MTAVSTVSTVPIPGAATSAGATPGAAGPLAGFEALLAALFGGAEPAAGDLPQAGQPAPGAAGAPSALPVAVPGAAPAVAADAAGLPAQTKDPEAQPDAAAPAPDAAQTCLDANMALITALAVPAAPAPPPTAVAAEPTAAPPPAAPGKGKAHAAVPSPADAALQAAFDDNLTQAAVAADAAPPEATPQPMQTPRPAKAEARPAKPAPFTAAPAAPASATATAATDAAVEPLVAQGPAAAAAAAAATPKDAPVAAAPAAQAQAAAELAPPPAATAAPARGPETPRTPRTEAQRREGERTEAFAAAGPNAAPAAPRTGGALTAPAAAEAAAEGAGKDLAALEPAALDAPVEAKDTPDAAQATAPAGPSANGPAAAHAAALAVRGSPETVANFAAQIIKKLDGRSTKFDVELDPAGLGKVSVQVEIGAHGRVTAAMSFDNPAAANELRSRSAELQRSLEQAGFDLSGGMSFDVAGDQGRWNQGQTAQQDRDPGSAFRGRAFQAALDTAGEADVAAGPLSLRQGLRSGVDVRI